jgi:hypothetical protein
MQAYRRGDVVDRCVRASSTQGLEHPDPADAGQRLVPAPGDGDGSPFASHGLQFARES